MIYLCFWLLVAYVDMNPFLKDTECLVMNEGAGVNITDDKCGQGIEQLLVTESISDHFLWLGIAQIEGEFGRFFYASQLTTTTWL